MYVTIQDRKLLPYVFTLTPKSGIFSVALSVCYFHNSLPVRKRVALCCPDFPLLSKKSSDRTSLLLRKSSYFTRKNPNFFSISAKRCKDIKNLRNLIT